MMEICMFLPVTCRKHFLMTQSSVVEVDYFVAAAVTITGNFHVVMLVTL